MKKLLVLPLVLLSFYVIAADERIGLLSNDWETAEAEDNMSSADTTLKGSGLRLFSFTNDGVYFGAGFSYAWGDSESGERESGDIEAGDYEYCDYGSDCGSSLPILSAVGRSFVEIGRSMGQWTPFVGISFTRTEVDLRGDPEREDSQGLSAGLWLHVDKFMLRGTVVHLDDEDNRAIFGGMLYSVNERYVVGAEFGINLDSDFDGFKLSFQIGRRFN